MHETGTAIMITYKGAIVKPLSPEEVLDIGELRLAVIALVAKPAHHHLSPADFELLDGLDPPTGALQRNHAAARRLLARFQPFTSKKSRKSLSHSFRWQIKCRNRVLNVEKCLRQVMALMDGEDIVEFNKVVFDLFKARRVVDEKEQAAF
jgi:hypothetical protein